MFTHNTFSNINNNTNNYIYNNITIFFFFKRLSFDIINFTTKSVFYYRDIVYINYYFNIKAVSLISFTNKKNKIFRFEISKYNYRVDNQYKQIYVLS